MPTTSRRRANQRAWYAKTKRRARLDSVPQLPDRLARDGNTADEAEADAVIKAACEALHGLREFREDKVEGVTVREWWADPKDGMRFVVEIR